MISLSTPGNDSCRSSHALFFAATRWCSNCDVSTGAPIIRCKPPFGGAPQNLPSKPHPGKYASKTTNVYAGPQSEGDSGKALYSGKQDSSRRGEEVRKAAGSRRRAPPLPPAPPSPGTSSPVPELARERRKRTQASAVTLQGARSKQHGHERRSGRDQPGALRSAPPRLCFSFVGTGDLRQGAATPSL